MRILLTAAALVVVLSGCGGLPPLPPPSCPTVPAEGAPCCESEIGDRCVAGQGWACEPGWPGEAGPVWFTNGPCVTINEWRGFLFRVSSCTGDVMEPPAFSSVDKGEAQWSTGETLVAQGAECAPRLLFRDGSFELSPGPCGAGHVDRGRLVPQPDGSLSVDIETSVRSPSADCHGREWGTLQPRP